MIRVYRSPVRAPFDIYRWKRTWFVNLGRLTIQLGPPAYI